MSSEPHTQPAKPSGSVRRKSGYLIEGTEAKRRVTVDMDRFIIDLCKRLGRPAYMERLAAHAEAEGQKLRPMGVISAPQGLRGNPVAPPKLAGSPSGKVIRFRDEDYELRFETGGQLGGPGRVSIICALIDDVEPIAAFNAGAHRPMRDIVADIRKKFLDDIDVLAAPHRERRVVEHRQRTTFQRRLRKFVEDFPEFKLNEKTNEAGDSLYQFSGYIGPFENARFARMITPNIGAILARSMGMRLRMDAMLPDQVFHEICEVLRKHKLLSV